MGVSRLERETVSRTAAAGLVTSLATSPVTRISPLCCVPRQRTSVVRCGPWRESSARTPADSDRCSTSIPHPSHIHVNPHNNLCRGWLATSTTTVFSYHTHPSSPCVSFSLSPCLPPSTSVPRFSARLGRSSSAADSAVRHCSCSRGCRCPFVTSRFRKRSGAAAPAGRTPSAPAPVPAAARSRKRTRSSSSTRPASASTAASFSDSSRAAAAHTSGYRRTDEKDNNSDDDDDEDEDAGERHKRLHLAAVNSVTGETNALALTARRYNNTSLTSQQVVAELRALQLVDGRQLRPLSQWTAQQTGDIVKFIRGRRAVVHSRPSYADEATFSLDVQLTSRLQDMLSAEADINSDMAVHFDPYMIAIQNWGPVYGGTVNRVDGVTNEPGSAANPNLLPGGAPQGIDRGINQTWGNRMDVLDHQLGGVGQVDAPGCRLSYWNNDVTTLLVATPEERNQALAWIRQLLGAGSSVVWQEVRHHAVPVQW